jgi:hypothetical protein
MKNFYILNFFDKDKECPEKLKSLKEDYFKEFELLEVDCKNCSLKQLRDKYLNILISYKNDDN